MPARKRHRDPSPRLVRKVERAKPGPMFQPWPPGPMSDEAWECAPRNGNPLPVAECGGRHAGPCCSCGGGGYFGCCRSRA